MKNYKSLLLVVFVGLISAISLVYFYTVQRNFTQKHKEFLISINYLDDAHNQLESSILLNSLYAYNDEDEVANSINNVQNTLKKLKLATILKDNNYISIKNKIDRLEIKINKNLLNIESYTMLNAGIKNSLIFLTRHVEKAIKLNAKDRFLYIKANKIIQIYTNTKTIQDLDYLKNKNILITSNTDSLKTKKFIEDFNLHSNYIREKLEPYINITKNILNNKIKDKIDNIRNNFSNIALNDFKFLDRFAILLFMIFILSFMLIIFLIISFIKEQSKLIKATKSLEHSYRYDYLTDIYNRNSFEDNLSKLNKPHLLIVNVDGFKQINDVYGNSFGNKMLKDIASYIKEYLKSYGSASLYRLGGDEFGILFEDINSQYALEIAYNLEEKISEHTFIIEPLRISLTVSIASNNIAPILENTDLALKELKKDKTKKVIEYKESYNLKKNIEENLEILSIIKKALKEDRVVPFFQPIVNLQTLKIEKYEALVRIIQKDGTILPPFKFLDISRKTQYYQEITRTMIKKTMAVAKEYPYRFSINFSMADILNKDIVNTLFASFKEDIQTSSRIDIELLESESLTDIKKVQNFIKKAHSFGSKILIDDFGSGYSNFAYFSSLDIDIIKIDGSIVSKIVKHKRELHMLKIIHDFSVGMDMKNVAEFVESREIALLLQELGVTYAQGYYFGKPEKKPLKSDSLVTL